VTFLVPFFSLVWAVLFLGEAFTAGVAAGMSLILVSVGLVLGAGKKSDLKN
jgi:drug/metabolite transporter (DMT)-like permease